MKRNATATFLTMLIVETDPNRRQDRHYQATVNVAPNQTVVTAAQQTAPNFSSASTAILSSLIVQRDWSTARKIKYAITNRKWTARVRLPHGHRQRRQKPRQDPPDRPNLLNQAAAVPVIRVSNNQAVQAVIQASSSQAGETTTFQTETKIQKNRTIQIHPTNPISRTYPHR